MVQSTWLEREFIFPERERERFKRTEHSRARGEVKRALREVCPGYLNSALRDLPMVVLTN